MTKKATEGPEKEDENRRRAGAFWWWKIGAGFLTRGSSGYDRLLLQRF